MRLFTGISIPEDVTGNLSRLLDVLRPAAHLRWSPVYNLHITTKFIGEWPETRLEELKSALAPLARRDPVEVEVNGIGWLPNPHVPRLLFASVRCGSEGGQGLTQLAQDTDEALSALGIARETRPFRPHLTLARIKEPGASLNALRQAIARLDHTDFGHFTAAEFCLYLSEPGPAGSIYTQLADFRFSNQ